MKKYVFLVPDNLGEFLFSDITLVDNCKVVVIKRSFLGKVLLGKRSPVALLLRKLSLEKKLNDKKFCYSLGGLKKMFSVSNSKTEYVIIFVAATASLFKKSFFIKLKTHSNYIFLLLVMDSYHASSPTIHDMKKDKIFDLNWNGIYTFDKFDANEFGWRYINNCYYSMGKFQKKLSVLPIVYDASFVGGLKGNRTSVIKDLLKLFNMNNISHRFVVATMGFKSEELEQYNSVKLVSKWIKYTDVLKQSASSNCIVEVLQENQQAQSLRYFEAIALNKKLLTNNSHIFELPYYDERYMKYFNDISDIDVEWLKKREKIDYGYRNEYSPLNFLYQIQNDLSENNVQVFNIRDFVDNIGGGV